jgi:two-component system, sensor histidine kinase
MGEGASISANGWAWVAQVRYRELKTRMGLAAFIALTGWFLAQGVGPFVWPTRSGCA